MKYHIDRSITAKFKDMIKLLNDDQLTELGMWLDGNPDAIHVMIELVYQETKRRKLRW